MYLILLYELGDTFKLGQKLGNLLSNSECPKWPCRFSKSRYYFQRLFQQENTVCSVTATVLIPIRNVDFNCRISSKRCDAYLISKHKREKRLFESKKNYSHGISKLCNFLFYIPIINILWYLVLNIPELLVTFIFS